MLKSYFKTALRSLLKNKFFSLINIFGLAAGTLCCLYILLYVQDQRGYDKHHENAGDIYRITSELVINGIKHPNATCSPPVAPALKRDFPEVLQYTRVVPSYGVIKHLLSFRGKSFYETGAVYVDPAFFNVFSYHFVHGNASNTVTEPYSVVLLKPVAEKLFGTENPVGKVIIINDGFGKHNFKITGVVDESLGKSHLQARMFIAMNSGGMGSATLKNTLWAGSNFTYSYIKLRPNANTASFEKKLPSFLNKYGGEQIKQAGMEKSLQLQPVTAIHTTTGYEIETGKAVGSSFLYLLMLIAGLIQIIACINFMNLSTARASKRAKEVGIRKVIGAGKYDLILQFLLESLLLAFVGVLIALPLLYFMLPYLNQLTGASVQMAFFNDYRPWILLASLVLFTGFAAGSYPAFYLSAFKAVKVIKGNFTSQISASGIRRSLVVFQFVLSIVLIGGVVVIYSQLNFIKNKDLGFEKGQRLVFSFYTADAQSKITAFSNDLAQLAEVKSVSKVSNYPSQLLTSDDGAYLEGGNKAAAIDALNLSADERFLQTSGVKLISGRDFVPTDSATALINETLAKKLGLNPQTAPGKKLYSQYDPNPLAFVTVTGVIKDFNYNSLHSDITPFMLVYDANPQHLPYLIAAFNSRNYKALIEQIAAIWKRDLPAVPFEYVFLDDEVQKQYETEIILSKIINTFTVMAIIISCLGLFGLASFSAEQRSKEIGIRKVLGSSVSGIVRLLSKDFLILVVLSFVIATPISWYCTSLWLRSFAYKVPLSWWMFGLAGLLAMLIALFTVGFQAVKAALINPVESLRSG